MKNHTTSDFKLLLLFILAVALFVAALIVHFRTDNLWLPPILGFFGMVTFGIMFGLVSRNNADRSINNN